MCLNNLKYDWRVSQSEIYFEDFKHFYCYILHFLYVRRMW